MLLTVAYLAIVAIVYSLIFQFFSKLFKEFYNVKLFHHTLIFMM